MKNNKIKILSTRPLAHTSMLKGSAAGVAIDIESFIEIKSIVDPKVSRKIREYATQEISTAFTSMNAAEAVIDCLSSDEIIPDWTIYSMGGITSTIIKNYFEGSDIVASATNSAELAESILDDDVEELVFFCGNQRREELPQLLQRQGVRLQELVVYETIETPVKVEQDYNGILFFSPTAVRSFFSVNTVNPEAVVFAIGTTTANALREATTNKLIVGDFPDKEKLAEKAIAYFS